ncbi:unnamed protein product [Staurois parvus]|uniref:Uncharacterized protein n=1 Tax=Staurois parvus TaxID=386267 RepID=A0ABN9CAE2_9NEOB|nr:unnamed protein product [Staurois parvus]
MLFDPDFSDPPLLPVHPFYLLIRHIVWRHSAHAQFGVYLLERVFISWDSVFQHRANQHCPVRGSGVMQPLIGQLEQKKNSSYKL